MRRVLITGMSGSGKSAVTRALGARGYRAVDLDTPEWSHWVAAAAGDMLTPSAGQDWVWQEDRVRELLLSPEAHAAQSAVQAANEVMFVSGCAENMDRLLPLIDVVILLSAPLATIMDRLAARSADGYGRLAEQRATVAALMATVEPLLRESAHHEIDTRAPIDATVDRILELSSVSRGV